MKSLNRTEFENEWKGRFESITVEPREIVWTRIDAELANRNASNLKRRILFFKMLAAASFLFALGLGYFTLINNNKPRHVELQVNQQHEKPMGNALTPTNPANTIIDSVMTDISHQTVSQPAQSSLNQSRNSTPENYSLVMSDQKDVVIHENKTSENEITPVMHKGISINKNPLVPRYPALKPDVTGEVILPERSQDIPAMWAGIDFSSGLFNPNISYGPRMTAFDFSPGKAAAAYAAAPAPTNNRSQIEKPVYNPSFSYAYGASVGYPLGPNWVLQSGLSYLYASSTTSVDTYIESSSSNTKYAYQSLNYGLNAFQQPGINAVVSSGNKINLNNVYEFISFPVNAGYKIVNKKLKIIASGGLSAEIMLVDRIYDPGNFLNETEIFPGNHSPYRRTYLNGTLGGNIFYPFLKNYQFGISPSYRFGINYLTRESASFNSKPSAFMITLGVSYIFK